MAEHKLFHWVLTQNRCHGVAPSRTELMEKAQASVPSSVNSLQTPKTAFLHKKNQRSLFMVFKTIFPQSKTAKIVTGPGPATSMTCVGKSKPISTKKHKSALSKSLVVCSNRLLCLGRRKFQRNSKLVYLAKNIKTCHTSNASKHDRCVYLRAKLLSCHNCCCSNHFCVCIVFVLMICPKFEIVVFPFRFLVFLVKTFHVIRTFLVCFGPKR